MHQTGAIGHLTAGKWGFFAGTTMILLSRRGKCRRHQERRLTALRVVLGGLALAVSPLLAQSGRNQAQSQAPANSQPAQDIPDAPSTLQPPPPQLPAHMPPEPGTRP